MTSSLWTGSRKYESCQDVVHPPLEGTNVLLPNYEVLQRHKASGFFFGKRNILLTLLLFPFSEPAVITVFYFSALEVNLSDILAKVSGCLLLSLLPLFLYSFNKHLLRS